jgi:LuxR family maltose regulon positive regulatory protein
MVGPLLSSKYRVPSQRADAVPRDRLAERLGSAIHEPLTVLAAPAGFGKTTLLTQWLGDASARGAAVAYLGLDRRDNDPALFWSYLVTAIQSVVPGFGVATLQRLAASSVDDATLAAMLNEIEDLSIDLVVALDDYHVIEAPGVHDGMAFVLEHQPPQLHVILATRADPPLPIAQIRARGRLVEVRAADLRFTVDEAAAYLNAAMGLALTDHDVAALEERTEGWIAALQLAALSLQGRSDASAFIAGFAGDDHYVVDYLAEEVLDRQSADVRDFLLRTSILESLTGPLCDAVTGRPGGKATLVALERANLFLVPLDDRRRWYRYHHLFGDVLRAHLLDERPHEVAELHQRASAWFEANGDTSQAITHALAAGDPGRAATLMELAMPTMRRERREAELAGWVRALPDDVLRTRPVLAVAFVGALTQALKFDSVAERLDAVEALVRTPDGVWPEKPPPHVIVVDDDDYRSLPAHIEMYRAAHALAKGDLTGTIAHAHDALSLAPPGDPLARAAAGALAGLASWSTGDLAGAHAAYTESVAGLTSAGFLADVLGCTITLGDIRRTQGRLTAAVSTYRRALDLTESPVGTEPLRGTADMHVGLAGVLLERNDLAGAREHLATARQLGEHNGLPQNPYRWRVVMARLREAEGDADEALRLLNEAERVYVGDFAPDVQPVPAVRARLRIRRNELREARAWADERQLTTDDAASYLREFEYLTLARLHIAQRRAEPGSPEAVPAMLAVLALLDRLRVAADSGGRGATVIEILMLRAAAHDARGDSSAAIAALRDAVTLAEPERYVRLFVEEGPPMAALLRALRKQPDAPPYVSALIAATVSQPSRGSIAQTLVDPLSERELDVLRLLAGDLGGPAIARQLFVSLNTVRTHTKNIYSKLGVTGRRDAVRQARELGLIPGGQPPR